MENQKIKPSLQPFNVSEALCRCILNYDTLLEEKDIELSTELDWTGKKVMAVMTYEGSGLGSCGRDLKRICTGAAFGRGLSVHGADAAGSERTVASWTKKQ